MRNIMLPLYSVNKLFSDNQSDNKPAMAQRLMLTPILLLALVLPLPGYAGDGHDHEHASSQNQTLSEPGKEYEHEQDEHNDNENSVHLSAEQIQQAGIISRIIPAEKTDIPLRAPAEIRANGYRSFVVSPRVDSVVITRHVALGDHVQPGQPLLTLFSEGVASAQAELRSARSEWQRVKNLGKNAAGAARYNQAENTLAAARARLTAYGLNADAELTPASFGEYQLTAQTAGLVLSDDFQQGQRVTAGSALMQITDETTLWAEARLPAESELHLTRDTRVMLNVAGLNISAQISHESHTIDPLTRTRIVRLTVENPDHRLHPGLFASADFYTRSENPITLVPETALVRGSDGDWQIFIESTPGEFSALEVERGRTIRTIQTTERTTSNAGEILIEISSKDSAALSEYSVSQYPIVVAGAFFIASEQAKGGFDPHNH
ncbi:efflux RND transporter periplasmic adaptor subunit [Thalassolituus alkanivorans]|uniref:efflux RND transporter periplasmic adaptor subunit n=1 Tax=Thalassolituus alkanivorans TaxID=2881055 RepID=UPI001E506AB8|nr:efflux RND transporter periplasmic adaptor subunit [Thalassolituus alkanivorans]MCB2387619.1 efflux RND transporter periplasmic adaptor subunit [Thalassolituus alkanivorans]MCB2424752.1 efflux RND transporter periplasmic adaptor subunit [Thalassolituus alkanivorans]